MNKNDRRGAAEVPPLPVHERRLSVSFTTGSWRTERCASWLGTNGRSVLFPLQEHTTALSDWHVLKGKDMLKQLFVSAAFSALALSSALTSAQAAPFSGGTIVIGEKGAGIDKIWWKRVCDRDGDRCHRVWIRNDDDRPYFRFRFRDRDGDERRHRDHDHDRDDRR